MKRLIESIRAWWRSITTTSQFPTPPAQPPAPPAQPPAPPAQPPAPPAQPPAPPAQPPAEAWTPGPLTPLEPWPKHVFIWGESQDAADVGKMLLQCGFKTDSPVVVIAKSGKSPVGSTARLIWHPVNERNVAISEVMSRIDRARRDGLSTVAVDTESEACLYSNMSMIARRAQQNGMKVIQTPKAYLDHLPGTETEDCAALNNYADAALLWIYGSHWSERVGNGASWEDLIRMWHDNGLMIQAIPMCDSGRRDGNEPYNTEADILQILRGAHAAGLSVGLFNPTLPLSREELTEAARLYR